MKILIFLILLISAQTANALGPEEQEFVGKLRNNRYVTLGFKSDPNIYGSGIKALSTCAYLGDSVVCSFDGNKKIIYQLGTKKSKKFSLASKLYNELYPNKKIRKWNSDGVYSDIFFECTEGCSANVPNFFILITHGD